MSTDDRLEKLERFFKEVADLTVHHEVIAGEAVVYPSSLGEALSRVDSDWRHNAVDSVLRRKTLDDLSRAEYEDGTYDRVPEQ
jgi:hypothetical protein